MGAPPQTPELAGSWLIYCLPCSVRLGSQQLGDSVPVRLGDQGVCHRGASSGRNARVDSSLWIRPGDLPTSVQSSSFPVPLERRLPWFGRSRSSGPGVLQSGASVGVHLKHVCSGHCQGARGACLREQFSGNPTVGPLRAGTASLVLPSLTVSTEHLYIPSVPQEWCSAWGSMHGQFSPDSRGSWSSLG